MELLYLMKNKLAGVVESFEYLRWIGATQW